MENKLWKYCTKEHCREFLLSLNLTGNMELSEDKKLALLYGLSNHRDEHYRKARIPKKSGGFRTLYIPDSLLKYVQRQILKNILYAFPVSPCAFAYKKGCSPVSNAEPHLSAPCILKLDISDFFPSITYLQIYQSVFPGELFPPSVRTLLSNLCCFHDVLPQGSPVAPCISNLVMRPFDTYMDAWCRERDIVYTRYCDDMTFSGSFSPIPVIRKTQGFLDSMGFELNRRKIRIMGKGSRQLITGIVVNEKLQAPKEYRRKLRQELHYIEKFGLSEHLKSIAYSGSPEKYLLSLKGRIQYVLQINPLDPAFQDFQKILDNCTENCPEKRCL